MSGLNSMGNYQKLCHRIKPLFAGVVAASGLAVSAPATSGTYTVVLTGAIVDVLTSVMGVPGVPTTPLPPLYQDPRLVDWGGTGWATQHTVSIDSKSGKVIDFEERLLDGYQYGTGGNTAHMHGPGDTWYPGIGFNSGCTVVSANPGETGTIVYDCPPLINQPLIASLGS